jgi:hypothetical protein
VCDISSSTIIPQSNAIVNAVFYISYRPQLQADVFAVLFMNELKSLTNIVVGKLDKLGLHRSTSPEKEKRYIKYRPLLLIQWFLVHILIHVPVHCRHCFYCNSKAKPHILQDKTRQDFIYTTSDTQVYKRT